MNYPDRRIAIRAVITAAFVLTWLGCGDEDISARAGEATLVPS